MIFMKSWEIKRLEGRLRKAIKGFMQLNPKYNNYTNKFKGKKIVIFDDNISSGATMDDCCLCLQKIGVNLNDILVLTFGVWVFIQSGTRVYSFRKTLRVCRSFSVR